MIKFYLVVMDYQKADQRFWSGKRWQQDPSDGWIYSSYSDARLARKAANVKAPRGTTTIVENYGFIDENECCV